MQIDELSKPNRLIFASVNFFLTVSGVNRLLFESSHLCSDYLRWFYTIISLKPAMRSLSEIGHGKQGKREGGCRNSEKSL